MSNIIFDRDAYVWRYHDTGAELTADEVSALGRDPGLRDITTLEDATAHAARLGTEAGTGAASWAFDGNTAPHIYEAFLRGLEAGDPLVTDYYAPGRPLSGEWADGMTPATLAEAVDVDYAGTDTRDMDAICDAFEEAFEAAYWAELERVARLHVTD